MQFIMFFRQKNKNPSFFGKVLEGVMGRTLLSVLDKYGGTFLKLLNAKENLCCIISMVHGIGKDI